MTVHSKSDTLFLVFLKCQYNWQFLFLLWVQSEINGRSQHGRPQHKYAGDQRRQRHHGLRRGCVRSRRRVENHAPPYSWRGRCHGGNSSKSATLLTDSLFFHSCSSRPITLYRKLFGPFLPGEHRVTRGAHSFQFHSLKGMMGQVGGPGPYWRAQMMWIWVMNEKAHPHTFK